MQDAKSFIARVDATRAILATTAGRPGHEGVVDNERAELLLLLGGITVRGQDAAAVIAAIKGAALPGDLEEALISRLCERLSEQAPGLEPTAQMPSSASRGGANNQGFVFQDFTAIVNYIPEEIWSYARESERDVHLADGRCVRPSSRQRGDVQDVVVVHDCFHEGLGARVQYARATADGHDENH